jgi:hypothetical protein
VSATVDPGDSLVTPGGIGRLGSPVGTGRTYADPGGSLPSSTPPDGTQGSVTMDQPMAALQDATGSRSANG